MGQFGGEKPLFGLSVLAGADLTAKRYLAMKLNSAGAAIVAGAGESAVGILQTPEESGKVVNVMQLGISFAVLGAPVANAGVNLTPDSAGKLVTAGGGDAVIAFNLVAGTTGDIVPVCLVTRASAGSTGIGAAYNTITLPVTLSTLDNNEVLTDFTPGYAGKIKSIAFVADVPASTATKTADVHVEIGATPTTGGVLALTTVGCNARGKVVAGSAISALNTFGATDTISVVVADTATPFIEGTGSILVTIEI